MKKRAMAAIGLLVLITAVIIFIWSQSLLPRNLSAQESGTVRKWLVDLLGEKFNKTGFHEAVRTAAHFAEFNFLGILVAVAASLVSVDRRFYVWSFGPAIAIVDEGTQLFADGRAFEWIDILVDCAGYFCGVLTVFFIVWLIQQHKRQKDEKN